MWGLEWWEKIMVIYFLIIFGAAAAWMVFLAVYGIWDVCSKP